MRVCVFMWLCVYECCVYVFVCIWSVSVCVIVCGCVHVCFMLIRIFHLYVVSYMLRLCKCVRVFVVCVVLCVCVL